MDEKEVEKIKEEAKNLLDKFSIALEKIQSSEEFNVERKEDRRKDGNGKESDAVFRKVMFDNAPNKNDNFIIAEKKKW